MEIRSLTVWYLILKIKNGLSIAADFYQAIPENGVDVFLLIMAAHDDFYDAAGWVDKRLTPVTGCIYLFAAPKLDDRLLMATERY